MIRVEIVVPYGLTESGEPKILIIREAIRRDAEDFIEILLDKPKLKKLGLFRKPRGAK